MAFNLDQIFGIHAQSMQLTGRRTELLAANLANADTPGYKARDLDFQAELARLQGGSNPSNMIRTHTSHLSGGDMGGDGFTVMYRIPEQPSIDGNTVNSQREKARFTENVMHYQASLTFLDGKIKDLIQVIRGE